MTKQDLKTGMLVITRDGNQGLVFRGRTRPDAIVSDGNMSGKVWIPLDSFYGNLQYRSKSSVNIKHDSDIVKVYSDTDNVNAASISLHGRILLWERTESSKVKLNEEYTAVLHPEKQVVTVGCQEIPFEAVKELWNQISKS